MNAFTLHTVSSAPEAARGHLEQAERQLGFVPNLYAQLANAPSSLEGYRALATIFEKVSLTPTEQQVVLLATSVENRCEFCVAVHSFIAKNMVKVDPEVVGALRRAQELSDPKLNALAAFTRLVVRERGWVNQEHLDGFIGAGYRPDQALEVVLGVTLKTLSNYTNHLTQTPLNEQFQSEKWSASEIG
jgi:AhpD family alkylhydroperoxidase